MTDPILIVGGGPAALAAARGYRDAGGGAHVVLVTDDDRPPYRRPPLSKEYLRGELDASELALEGDEWYPAHDVEIVHDQVVELDPVARRARTESGRELTYEGAVLATGATPVRPPVDGADGPVTDARSSELASVTGPETRVVVVGAGFIGCEAAVSLARRGARVTLVADEGVPQERRLGADVGGRIASWLQQEGVELLLGAPIDAIDPGPDVLVGDVRIAADVVLLGSGVALGPDGRHVAVDATMATSAPGVRAAGDVTFAGHAVAGRSLHVEHWGDALAHGEVAGRRLAGDTEAQWDGVPGFWSTIGDRTLKYAAWGDGYDSVELESDGEAFTAWYRRDGRLVGVLTHDRDEDYDMGAERIAAEVAT